MKENRLNQELIYYMVYKPSVVVKFNICTNQCYDNIERAGIYGKFT
jgi:hypothetical protein